MSSNCWYTVGDYIGAWLFPCVYIPCMYCSEIRETIPRGSTCKFLGEIYTCKACRDVNCEYSPITLSKCPYVKN